MLVPEHREHDRGVPIVVSRAGVLPAGAEAPAHGVELGVATGGEELIAFTRHGCWARAAVARAAVRGGEVRELGVMARRVGALRDGGTKEASGRTRDCVLLH